MAARLGRERVHQKKALAWIAGSYQRRDMLEVTPRLLLGPRGAPGRQPLQVEERRRRYRNGPGRNASVRNETRVHSGLSGLRVLCRLVTTVAAVMARPPFQEDGLDMSPVKFKIKRGRL